MTTGWFQVLPFMASILASSCSLSGVGLDLFGQLDQFVDHFLGGEGSVVVGSQVLLQNLAEGSRLDDV